MRAATWNLWWRFGGNWRDREHGIVATLLAVEPDLVGLQEVWEADGTTQVDVLAEQVGLHGAYVECGVPPVDDEDQAGVGMGVGLLSRWPIAEVHARPLPCQDSELNALVATVEHPDGPLHVIVTGTSWETDRVDELTEQLQQLAALATDPLLDGPLPVVVLADLNAPPTFPGMQPLLDRLVDPWPQDGSDPRTLSETNRFATPEAELQFNQRIDYVLARPGRASDRVDVSEARIVRHEPRGLPPSDHYLVMADVEQVPAQVDRREVSIQRWRATRPA